MFKCLFLSMHLLAAIELSLNIVNNILMSKLENITDFLWPSPAEDLQTKEIMLLLVAGDM